MSLILSKGKKIYFQKICSFFFFFLPQHELILNCYTKGIHTKTICHIENVRDNAQTKCDRILTREKYIHGIMLHCKLVLCETLRK